MVWSRSSDCRQPGRDAHQRAADGTGGFCPRSRYPRPMEYVQERIATLQRLRRDGAGCAPTDRAAVVVPLTGGTTPVLAAERVFSRLERVDRRASSSRCGPHRTRSATSSAGSTASTSTGRCCGATRRRSSRASTSAGWTGTGKGRDVWLALGVAARHDYVVVHDADATTYSVAHVPKLLFPLANGFQFSKGYYARVENGRLYGPPLPAVRPAAAPGARRGDRPPARRLPAGVPLRPGR